jgi:membrane-bound inhibitor of C-type lysozyme
MRVSNLLSAAAASAALLASAPVLAGDAAANNEWRQVAYTCETGESLTVAFRETGSSVRVNAPGDGDVRLNVRPARDGFRFSNPRPERLSDSRYELRGEVDTVTWKIGLGTPLKCTSGDPAAALLAATASRAS